MTVAASKKKKSKKKKRGPGQPTRINDVVELEDDEGKTRKVLITELIAERIVMGLTMKAATDSVGLGYQTANGWIRRGDAAAAEGKPDLYSAFAASITRARGEFRAKHVKIIADAGTADWRASAWLLERMADEYRERRYVSDPDKTEKLNDDEAKEVVRDAARRLRLEK